MALVAFFTFTVFTDLICSINKCRLSLSCSEFRFFWFSVCPSGRGGPPSGRAGPYFLVKKKVGKDFPKVPFGIRPHRELCVTRCLTQVRTLLSRVFTFAVCSLRRRAPAATHRWLGALALRGSYPGRVERGWRTRLCDCLFWSGVRSFGGALPPAATLSSARRLAF